MKQERSERGKYSNLHYFCGSLSNHARDLQNQTFFPENTKNRLIDLIGQFREAPDSRHRLRIAKKIESTVISIGAR